MSYAKKNIKIPPSLHKKLKQRCLDKNMILFDVATEVIKQGLKTLKEEE